MRSEYAVAMLNEPQNATRGVQYKTIQYPI